MHHQPLCVGGKPPPLCWITELPDLFEGFLVVHVADVRQPGKVIDVIAEDGDSFTEQALREHLLLYDSPGF